MYSTSSYKWYGPHAGITWVEPELLDQLRVYKVRPSPATGPGRLQLGTPAYESLAAIEAAAQFLLGEGMTRLAAHERALFTSLLDGLLAMPNVRVLGPHDTADRAPTLAFLVDGHTPNEVARALAAREIAVWDGNYYAVEVMDSYGLDIDSGAVRAGSPPTSTSPTSHDCSTPSPRSEAAGRRRPRLRPRRGGAVDGGAVEVSGAVGSVDGEHPVFVECDRHRPSCTRW